MSPPQSLPRGRHSIPRQLVRENQRTRLLNGAERALDDRSYADLAVAHIVGKAGVSRATFYILFEGKRQCVLQAHERAFAGLVDRIQAACGGFRAWEKRLSAGLGAALRFAVETPRQARLLTLDTIGADPVLADQALSSYRTLVTMLRAGRELHPPAVGLPDVTERALIGGIVSLVADRLMNEKSDELITLEPQMFELLLMPYRRSET